MQADLRLSTGGESFFLVAGGTCGFFGDTLTGEEILNHDTDKGDDNESDDENLPVILGKACVVNGGTGFIHIVENFAGIVGDWSAFSAHVVDKEQVEEEGENHAGKTHSCQHGCIGNGGKQAAVFAVAGGQADEGCMRGIIHRVGESKPQVIADGDADQSTGVPGFVQCVIRTEDKEEKQCDEAQRN